MSTTHLPIVLMSFAANDLPGVHNEAKNVWDSVQQASAVQAAKVEDADIEALADAIFDAGKELFFFHFGGHAEEGKIVLDGFRDLDKNRLSRLLLPKHHNTQIVFLNGCLSYGLVDIFTAKGVKAVIATNARVNDGEAARLSKYFYKLFFEKDYSLKEAFESAEATVGGSNSFVTIVNPGETAKLQPSWTLFIHAHHKEVMDWTLADFLKGASAADDSSATGTTSIGRQINMGDGSTFIENQYNAGGQAAAAIPPRVDRNRIHELVVNGRIDEALLILKQQLPESLGPITLLQTRFKNLSRESMMGTISTANANIERNQIVAAILELCG